MNITTNMTYKWLHHNLLWLNNVKNDRLFYHFFNFISVMLIIYK